MKSLKTCKQFENVNIDHHLKRDKGSLGIYLARIDDMDSLSLAD